MQAPKKNKCTYWSLHKVFVSVINSVPLAGHVYQLMWHLIRYFSNINSVTVSERYFCFDITLFMSISASLLVVLHYLLLTSNGKLCFSIYKESIYCDGTLF